MLIDEVVDFCDKDFSSKKCSGCGKNNLCHLDCSNCLDDLHYHNNHIRYDYCCEHLLNYYVCRYSYKYCSEIIYALRNIDLSKYPYFNILSLGCGASPDLMAFDFLNLSKKIKYKGFDINSSLEKIHNFISAHSSAESVDYLRECNVLELFDMYQVSNTNVIIIEYLISFFYSEIGNDGLCSWFDKLTEKVICVKPPESPLLIIINDADSIYVGRDMYLQLRKSIEGKGLKIINECKMRFQETEYFQGSKKYPSCANLFHIPDGFSEKYKVAIKCRSAQLILEVE